MIIRISGMAVVLAVGACLSFGRAHAALPSGFENSALEVWGTVKTQKEQLFDLSANHKDGELDRINRAVAHLVEESSPAMVKVIIPHPAGLGAAIGSGFIVDAGGLVVTNAHVVETPSLGAVVNVEINGKKAKAVVAARSFRKDVAILRIQERQTWPVMPLGSSMELMPGNMVVALGYPKGLPLSASMGIVSGVNRVMPNVYVKSIQSDAAINPGNSGGPLLSVDGAVIGVNTFIASESGGSEGLSFSIPVETVKHLLARHRAGGRIESGTLGVTIGSDTAKGAVIVEVASDSAADKVKIKAGDVFTAIDGVSLLREGSGAGAELVLRLSDKFAGDAVVISFERGGRPFQATAVLDEYKTSKLERIIRLPRKR